MIIVAESGGGKTNILCKALEELENKENIILFLKAVDFDNEIIEDQLKKALKINKEISWDKVYDKVKGGNLFIFIDGLNESSLGPAIMKNIDKFIAQFEIKIIASIRQELLSMIFPDIENLGIELKNFYFAGDERKNEKHYLVKLNRMDFIELKEMYERYTESNKFALKPLISYEELSYNKTLLNELTSPLILRLFCEVYNGKSIPDKLSVKDIFYELYLLIHSKYPDAGLNDFIMNLIEVFYDTQSNKVALDALYMEEKLKFELISPEIFSPYRILKKAGLIYEYSESLNEVYLLFTYDRLFEYFLGEYIKKYNFTLETALDLTEKSIFFPSLKGALVNAVSYKVISGNEEFLTGYLDKGPDMAGTIGGEVLIELKLKTDDLLKISNMLMKNISKNDIKALCLLMKNLIENIEYQKIIDIYPAIIDQLKTEEQKIEAEEMIYDIGIIFLNSSMWELSLRYLKISLNLRIKKYGEYHIKTAENYSDIGRMIFQVPPYNYNDSLVYYFRCLEILKKIGMENTWAYFVTLANIGRIYSEIDKADEALNYIKQAINLSNKHYPNGHLCFIYIFTELVFISENISNFNLALKYYERALTISIKLFTENHPETGIIYHQIGTMFHNLNEYEKTIYYFKKETKIYDKYGLQNKYYILGLQEISICYKKNKDFYEAIKYADHAIKYTSQNNNFESQIYSFYLKGKIFLEIKEFDKAIDSFKKSIMIANEINYCENDLTNVFFHLSNVYFSNNEKEKAINTLYDAIDFCKKNNFDNKIIELEQKIKALNHK